MQNITLKTNTGIELNIRIDERQSIRDTLTVLKENGKLYPIDGVEKIYSMRQKKYVNVLLTYEQAEIYNGDCFIL